MAAAKNIRGSLEGLGQRQLLEKAVTLAERASKLEELVAIISRGKYMWESTFDAITAPVQIVSSDYEIIRANLKLAAVAGKDIATIIGRKCYESFAGRKNPCEGCPLVRAIEGDDRVAVNLRNPISHLEFEVSAYPMGAVVEKGRAASAVLYYRDVTEERRLQREVTQQEKMAAIGMLAGGVAHEINNPLGGILAFVQLMRRDSAGNQLMQKDLEEVEKAAVRCKKIVSDLLDFSRVSKERDDGPIDVNTLLEKLFPFVQREITSLNIELVFRAGAELPCVMGVPDRLQQVFLNLMTNACHAMPKGGVLTVETRYNKAKGCVEVGVHDTGVGIAPEIRDKIFDPFFTTKKPGAGTGLGLSISYKIIKDHGGEIYCESEIGKGSEFTVRFPAARR